MIQFQTVMRCCIEIDTAPTNIIKMYGTDGNPALAPEPEMKWNLYAASPKSLKITGFLLKILRNLIWHRATKTLNMASNPAPALEAKKLWDLTDPDPAHHWFKILFMSAYDFGAMSHPVIFEAKHDHY